MENIILALGPAFVSAFAIQQFLEILDQVILFWASDDPRSHYQKHKKGILGLASLIIGTGVAFWTDLKMLSTLGANGVGYWPDHIITGVFISAGTEGFNSIVKFLGYAKESKKTDAASKSKAANESMAGALKRFARK